MSDFTGAVNLWHDPVTAVTPRGSRPSWTLDRPAKHPRALPKRGPRFDGTMRRPVAAVEARRSRSPSVADDVALMEVPGRKKRGAQSLIGYPSKESYAGSRRGEK
jgi:hypothetical protein